MEILSYKSTLVNGKHSILKGRHGRLSFNVGYGSSGKSQHFDNPMDIWDIYTNVSINRRQHSTGKLVNNTRNYKIEAQIATKNFGPHKILLYVYYY